MFDAEFVLFVAAAIGIGFLASLALDGLAHLLARISPRLDFLA